MNTTLLSADKDPMGTAIADYYKRHKAERLRVFSSQFDEDEIPVKELFRTEKQMPLLERTALQLATGKILDVGAGSGCNSLALQEAGKNVHAIDISPLSVAVMLQRGVRHATLLNLFDEHFHETYNTILMLMNGSGIIGKLENLPAFFKRIKQLLQPGGCIKAECLEINVKPVEWLSLNILILHLEIYFSIIVACQVDHKTSVFFLKQIAHIWQRYLHPDPIPKDK